MNQFNSNDIECFNKRCWQYYNRDDPIYDSTDLEMIYYCFVKKAKRETLDKSYEELLKKAEEEYNKVINTEHPKKEILVERNKLFVESISSNLNTYNKKRENFLANDKYYKLVITQFMNDYIFKPETQTIKKLIKEIKYVLMVNLLDYMKVIFELDKALPEYEEEFKELKVLKYDLSN